MKQGVQTQRLDLIKNTCRDELVSAWEQFVRENAGESLSRSASSHVSISNSGDGTIPVSMIGIALNLINSFKLSPVKEVEYADLIKGADVQKDMRINRHRFFAIACRIMYNRGAGDEYMKMRGRGGLMTWLGKHMFLQVVKDHFFSDFWNFLDLVLVILNPAVVLQIISMQISGMPCTEEACLSEVSVSPYEKCTLNNGVCGNDCATYPLPTSACRTLKSCGAFACLLLVLKLLYFMRPFRATGPLVKMIVQIIWDIRWFFFIQFVFSYAVFAAFFIIFTDSAFKGQQFPMEPGSINDHASRIINLVIGDFDNFIGMRDLSYKNFDLRFQLTLDDSTEPWAAKSVFVFSTFFITIVMANLLIAIMADSYASIRENALAEFLLEKGCIISEAECMMSEQELARTDWFPNYLHVLLPTSVFEHSQGEQEWAGVAHDIKSEIRTLQVAQTAMKEIIEKQQSELRTLSPLVNTIHANTNQVLNVLTRFNLKSLNSSI